MEILRKIPRQKRAHDLIDSVMTASANVLEKLKLKEFSTIKVAQEAGVSIGSLYQYFSSKDALLSLYIERQLNKHTEIFEGKIAEWSHLPLPEFSRLFAGFVTDYMLANPARLKILYLHAAQFDRADLLMCLRHRLIGKLAELFQQARLEPHDQNYHLRATVLVHACMGVLTAKIIDSEMAYDREALSAELVRLIDSYLGLRP